jgi:hypothetical protein
MKMRKFGLLVFIVGALLGFGSAAHAQWSQSFDDVVNGVSGTLTYDGSQDYTLIVNIGSSGAALGSRMTAVEIKDFSSYTGFTFTAPAGTTWVDPVGTSGISSGGAAGPDGCTSGAGGFACISASPTLQNALLIASGASYTFQFHVDGATGLNDRGIGAHVGVGFTQYDGTGNAGITSVTLIPEPEIYAMMGVGLGFLGWAARRKKVMESASA